MLKCLIDPFFTCPVRISSHPFHLFHSLQRVLLGCGVCGVFVLFGFVLFGLFVLFVCFRFFLSFLFPVACLHVSFTDWCRQQFREQKKFSVKMSALAFHSVVGLCIFVHLDCKIFSGPLNCLES